MATWLTIDGDDLPLIPLLEQIFGTLDPLLNSAAAAAQTAATALEVIETLIGVVGDPNELVRQAINALIQDLITNQVNVLLIKPTFLTDQGNRGLAGFGRIIQDALTDQGDINRPNFGANDTSGGVVIAVFAPSFQDLVPLAQAFQSLFGDGWREFIDYVNSLPGERPPFNLVGATGTVTSLVEGADPSSTFIDADLADLQNNTGSQWNGYRIDGFNGRNAGQSAIVNFFNPFDGRFFLDPGFSNDLEVGDAYVLNYIPQSKPPDWYTKRVIDVFPPLALAVDALARVRDQIPNAGGPLQDALNVLSRLINLLQAKVALIQNIIGQIQTIVALLQQLGNVTNLNVLPIPPQNFGDVGFITEFFRAQNPPPVAADSVALGLVLYGGSGIYGTLQQILPIP